MNKREKSIFIITVVVISLSGTILSILLNIPLSDIRNNYPVNANDEIDIDIPNDILDEWLFVIELEEITVSLKPSQESKYINTANNSLNITAGYLVNNEASEIYCSVIIRDYYNKGLNRTSMVVMIVSKRGYSILIDREYCAIILEKINIYIVHFAFEEWDLPLLLDEYYS